MSHILKRFGFVYVPFNEKSNGIPVVTRYDEIEQTMNRIITNIESDKSITWPD